ncbi:HAMP domain-containing methyl-accepting chemotaxis protein [Bacillus sp. 31A1R]|uniref:HAMP domain-containing methyl-accepting chemotaxis protein n=1 Tax=Robertmurraya mangrovi TaxID=3098077 RepID=A0ABU5IXY4_9BACI|nr:HAMP domain-containing methyl-accepting chemotaxis protein [Bacillus sp. 31A1R]MDZ5472001.1 HAMP domain-containing methyl-accepting chemotaxis protein [Bacillus sp. 31A1R]
MFRNLKVSTKIFTLIVVSILFLGGISVINYVALNSINKSASSIYNDKLVINQMFNTILTNNTKIDSIILEQILTTDASRQEELQNEFLAIVSVNKEVWPQLEGISMSPSVSEQFKKYKELAGMSNETKAKVDELAAVNRSQEAYNLYASDLKPIRSEMVNALSSIVQLNQEDAKIANDGNQKKFNQMVLLTIIIGISAIIICSLIGFVVARSIKKPISMIQSLMSLAQKGDLRVSGEYNSKDEIGLLTHNFNEMIKGLREIIEKVTNSSLLVASTSEEIAASSEQFSRATDEVTSSIQTVSSGIDQQVESIQLANQHLSHFTNQMKQLSGGVESATSAAVSSSKSAEEGHKIVSRTIEQMGYIDKQAYETADIINKLGEKSSQVGQIVSIITDISSQTNLLALNAAIEAARAGVHGKGFAIVADEVRKLAEQTVTAAEQINQLIKEIQVDTNQAVKSMNSTSTSLTEGTALISTAEDAFSKILASVETVAVQMNDISNVITVNNENTMHLVESMNSILHAAEESSNHSQNIAASAEQHNASLTEITSATQNLSQLADDLQHSALLFKVK